MVDAKSELAEELEEAWKASEAEPQADLTNLTFTLYECDHKEYEYKGEPREAYIAHVRVHGEEVERLFWIGGKSYPQVALLLEKAVLPVVLRQMRDTERQGQPYKLVLQDEAPQGRPSVVSAPGGQASTNSETLDASEMPAAIDVGGLFDEAVLITDETKVVGVLSDAGLDAIMDVGTNGLVFIVKEGMAIGNRVKAVNLLNQFLEAEKTARAAS